LTSTRSSFTFKRTKKLSSSLWRNDLRSFFKFRLIKLTMQWHKAGAAEATHRDRERERHNDEESKIKRDRDSH